MKVWARWPGAEDDLGFLLRIHRIEELDEVVQVILGEVSAVLYVREELRSEFVAPLVNLP